MYQFLDRRLDGLEAPATFLIRTMRNWVASVQQGRCPCRMTAAAFAANGLAAVADDFAMAMFTLNGEGLQQLHLAPPGCATVRDDEARLLALFMGPARGEGGASQQIAAHQFAATLVDEAAVPRLAQAAALVAAHVAASPVFTRFD